MTPWIAALMFAFGRAILSLFVSPSANGGESLGYALEFLRLMSACLPVLYVLYVIRSTLHGMGDTMTPMLSGVAEFVMRTGSALLLPRWIGYRGVFAAEVLAWIGADVILIAGYGRAREKYLSPRRQSTEQTGEE